MHRLAILCVETIIAAIFLIPIFLYLHRTRAWNLKKAISYLLFSLYLAAVYDVAGLPNVLLFRFCPRFNFIPFRYMFSDYGSSGLNVLLFLPLGFLLPLLWKKFRVFGHTLLLGFGVSVLIECLQIFTPRATDINDLMTNTLGTVLGYLAARCTIACFPAAAQSNPEKDLFQIITIAFSVMFFLQVFASKLLWTWIR